MFHPLCTRSGTLMNCVHRLTLEGLPSGLFPRAGGLLFSADSLAGKVI